MRVSVRRADELPPAPSGAPLAVASDPEAPVASEPAQNGLARVESPMVGTFYRAPQPGAPPFVAVGDVVVVGQTLCVLEAMKLMNEVKAELDGVVRAIHVENAQPVEFGQLLFEIEPVTAPPAV
jgi:acetyl-CoA carboxylase biotin carboxyl carrier protein